MAKTKLFDSYTYKLTLPAPFDSPNCTGAKSFGFSRYNTVSVQKSTLHAPTLRALLAYAKRKDRAGDGIYKENDSRKGG